MTDKKPKLIPWSRLVDEHKAAHTMSEEHAAAIWERIREAHPLVDYIVFGKPLHETLPIVVQQEWLAIAADNEAFRLAPAQRLWQVGRKLLRRVFRGIR